MLTPSEFCEFVRERQKTSPCVCPEIGDRDREVAEKVNAHWLEVFEGWLAAYPESVFTPPPPGEHGKTVDGCSAAMGRHVFKRLIEMGKALDLEEVLREDA